MNKIKNYWKKGKLQKAIIIIVVIFILAIIGGIVGGKKSTNIDYAFSTNENLKLDISEHNTSKAVDEITKKAMTDRNSHSKKESEETINNGLYFIKSNVDNLTKDNETMEKAIYYGYYIYSYIEKNTEAKNISELKDKDLAVYNVSYYTYTYVKYPYRKADGSRKNNLEIIKENLSKI